MKKYGAGDLLEAWKIFMGLCEDFPELYDVYVERVEKGMEGYAPDLVPAEEERMRAYEEILAEAEKGPGK